MEARKLNIQYTKAGSGSISTKLSVPKSWIDLLGINKESREVIAIFNEKEGSILVRKMHEDEKGMSNQEITAAIGNINATMEIEGFELTEEDNKDIQSILSGEVDADKLVSEIVEKYQK